MASCGNCIDVVESMTRKKKLDSDLTKTELNRCLGISDLVMMGIGYMVGTGIFILTGEVVRNNAGASAIISYVISGIAATLSAICYAEFAAYVPLAGSSYTYTYVVVGEIWAFLVGWNVILEYVIGTSAAAKSWSGTLDELSNGSISQTMLDTVGGFDSRWLSPYPDFVAVLIIGLVTVFVAVGAQASTNFNKVMVSFKLATIAIIIVAGFMLADVSNWTDQAKGGFMPFGISGILTGAATSFYAYVGFDGLAIASEETKNPRRTVPLGIIISMVIVMFLYIITTMVLTLMVPYYDVDVLSPYPEAFKERGEPWARYVVGIGTLFGVSTVILSGLFALPRVIYAMSRDGLLCKALGYVNTKTQTPLLPVILVGITSAILALIFDLDVLVNLLSIGTLFSFSFVSAALILIRYDKPTFELNETASTSAIDSQEEIPLKQNGAPASISEPSSENKSETTQILENEQETSNSITARYKALIKRYDKRKLVLNLLVVMTLNICVFILVLFYGIDYVKEAAWWAIVLLLLTSGGILLPLILMSSLEQVPKRDTFQVQSNTCIMS